MGELADEAEEEFEMFVAQVEPQLQRALAGHLPSGVVGDAVSEALAYAWEHRDRVLPMDNPAGYLYRVGCNRGRRLRRPLLLPDPAPDGSDPLVEPGLPKALAGLTERQRVCVMLVHGAGLTLTEAANALGITAGSVSRHVERGVERLRRSLRVTTDA